MKLIRVELNGYRCFAKAELDVDPQATVLMGPNDTGKSYLLLALKAFSDQQNFKDDDLCALLPDSSQELPQLSLVFSGFDPDEIDRLANLGLEFKSSDSLRVTRTGLKATQLAAFKNDSPLLVRAAPPHPIRRKQGNPLALTGTSQQKRVLPRIRKRRQPK